MGRCIHFVHLAKMEFKLKLILKIYLDKISKLILVCMRYFILIKYENSIRGDNL